MNNKEIVDYLIKNRDNGVAYRWMPEDVKVWLTVYRSKISNGLLEYYDADKSDWMPVFNSTKPFGADMILSLDKEYNVCVGEWVEFDIDTEGCFYPEGGEKVYYYWLDYAEFIKDNMKEYKHFGGWYFDGKWCMCPQVQSNERDLFSDFYVDSIKDKVLPMMPTKIRFWKDAGGKNDFR